MQAGRTPLLRAAERGHMDLVRKLAGQYDGDIFHKMKVCMEALLLGMHTRVHTCTVTFIITHSQTAPELPECPPLGSLQRPSTCPAVPLSHVWRQYA